MKRKLTFNGLLVAAMMVMGTTSAWAQTTWEFAGNTAVWAAEGVTLNGGAQYNEAGEAVAEGGVTFTGTSGFVSTARGIGFNAVGSTEDENISLVVPAGYKATVSVYTSGNRTVVGHFGEAADVTYNANWASSTKEFNNAEGTEAVTLYLYCNQNPGGDAQNKAPFLEKIVLTDMSSISSYPWTANAVATIDGEETILKTYSSEANVDEGSQYTIVVDKVIEKDGSYYALADGEFGADVYGVTYTMGGEPAVYNYTYEKVEGAVFYGEIEDIYTGGERANKAENITVLSNGGGYSAMGTEGYITVTFNVPEDAVYTLNLGMNNTNSRERGFNFAIDGGAVSETFTVASGKAYVHEMANQILTAGDHTLTMNITYSLTPIFDYLIISKVSDIATSVNVTVDGFATFASIFPLDFTGADIQAYTAKIDAENSKVVFKRVQQVPANTGVLLMGSGSADIPVIASAEAVDNDFIVGTGAAITSGYVLYEGDFYLANSETGTVVAKDKAYLPAVASEGRLTMVFDEATGIETAKTAAAQSSEIFNLAGQRVVKAQKGLYIVNGKKMLVK